MFLSRGLSGSMLLGRAHVWYKNQKPEAVGGRMPSCPAALVMGPNQLVPTWLTSSRKPNVLGICHLAFQCRPSLRRPICTRAGRLVRDAGATWRECVRVPQMKPKRIPQFRANLEACSLSSAVWLLLDPLQQKDSLPRPKCPDKFRGTTPCAC